MDRKSSDAPLAAEIAYHDYVALFCAMDAEWSLRQPVDGKDDGGVESLTWCLNDFADACRTFGNGVGEKYSLFCQGNGEKAGAGVAPYLFNPISLIPFGHADALSIVLLDDLDPIHRLTCDVRTTVEEVSLGLCPKLESVDLRKYANLAELHELIDSKAGEPHAGTTQIGNGYPPLHGFQDSLPLVVFTRYKMDGLALLGQSVLFQQALFRAMGKEIQRVLELQLEAIQCDDSAKALIPEKEDIQELKCVLLDLQGAEEIGTLVFCSNFSVAMAIVLALRSMTFQHVFDTVDGPRLLKLLGSSEAHRSVLKLWRSLHPKSTIDADPSALAQNHMFRWTCTSLAVSPRAFFEPENVPCRGRVEAAAGFQIAPGHWDRVEERLKDDVVKKASARKMRHSSYYRFTPGMTDLIVQYRDPGESGSFPPLLPLDMALHKVRENVRKFRRAAAPQDQGRDVVEIATTLTIPVLKSFRRGSSETVPICHPFGKKHFSPLGDILPDTQKRLCFLSDKHGHNQPSRAIKNGPHPGRLDFTEIKDVPRLYGLPMALRRTIEYLYLNFATLIADPFHFDAVLDLYDTFATLHATLTEHLPNALGEKSAEKSGMIDESRTEQLARLVGAIHNALMHRVCITYPESLVRDMAIDYRGGLNQILLAADAPVKCGMGLLRRYVLAQDDERDERHIVGAVTSVGFIPGARSYSLNFGTEHKVKLAYFEVDVPHVFHPPSYCDNLHECFHLVFEGLCAKLDNPMSRFPSPADIMGERLAEVFATLMSHLLVFPNDRDRFWHYNLTNFSKSQASTGADDRESLARFTEYLLRSFIAADAIPHNADRFHYPEEWPRGNDTLTSVFARLQDTIGEFGPYYSEYRPLWEGPNRENVQEYVRRRFDAIYPAVSEYMPIMWKEAVSLCKRFFERSVLDKAGSPIHSDDEMRNAIRMALREARPLVGSLLTPAPHAAPDWELDPLVLVCAALQEYVPQLDKIRGKAIHLFRDLKKNVGYPPSVKHLKDPDQPWYEFQVDKGSASMFCPVPDARRARLRKQIALLKTFWDVSSKLRARRLNEIITDNFEIP